MWTSESDVCRGPPGGQAPLVSAPIALRKTCPMSRGSGESNARPSVAFAMRPSTAGSASLPYAIATMCTGRPTL
jgi:hypothetical protein